MARGRVFMKPLTVGPTAPPDLRAIYAPIREELEQVEQLLRRELSSNHPFVDRLVKHGFRLGGKRLRPALLLFSAKAVGNLRQEHLALAAAVELIHMATLVHDDVLDEATLRRHFDTVNARWDNEASILLGDYLLARSLCLSASVGDTFACEAIGKACRTMCEGELRQIESRGNYELREEEYVHIIADKTAALMACCCRLGAHYAAAAADVEEGLARFGQHLGIAFQIADDLLDLLGDEATAGKSLGTDLAKQKLTLPLIRLLGQTSPLERRELLGILVPSENHRREALRSWFDRFDAVCYARDKALGYADRAREDLGVLPAGPMRDSMHAITDFVVQRQH
jgi:octaprenyl-diphosphate synthase